MILDWLSEGGRKAIGKMGWPEWCDEPRRRLYNVLGNDWEIQAESDAGFDHLEYIDGHVALALLRDGALEWLAERETWIEPSIPGPGWQVKIVATFGSMPLAWKRDYDLALIAAVLATEEGGR